MVVDDDEDARTLLAAQLSGLQYVVATTRDAHEALALIPSFDPHVIVTDHWMPGLLGTELVERVREFSSIPIVVYSAQGSIEICNKAHKSGAVEFLEYGEALKNLSSVLTTHLQMTPPQPSAMTQAQIAERHEQDEARRLEAMLLAHGGSVRSTASYLGMHRQTLEYKLRKHGLK
jgi:DNA-binding NtrC family response regulator